MDLKDMILVTENYKGTEKNMLMTLEDYKKFVSIEDMSELAEHIICCFLEEHLHKGKALRSITGQRMLRFLRSSVVMMWSLDASCKDITVILRSFILIRRQVHRSALQK